MLIMLLLSFTLHDIYVMESRATINILLPFQNSTATKYTTYLQLSSNYPIAYDMSSECIHSLNDLPVSNDWNVKKITALQNAKCLTLYNPNVNKTIYTSLNLKYQPHVTTLKSHWSMVLLKFTLLLVTPVVYYHL